MRLRRASTPGSGFGGRSDVELVEDAARGDQDAVEELYRRHAEAAWRVAQAVAPNADDAADAVSEAFTRLLQKAGTGRLRIDGPFRPYLFAAVRNAAIDAIRRGGRMDLNDRLDGFDRPGQTPEPHERVVAGVDAAYVASAFRDLPERWRSVLWLSEVEGLEPREIAEILRVTPNNAAQLAVRARAALRARYLQAHLAADAALACRDTVGKLGAYVAGRLAPRDVAAVDQHLAGCEACTERARQLEDVGSDLRRILLPLPLVLTPKALDMVRASTAASVPALSGGRTADLALRFQKPLLSATAGLAALGVISAAVIGNPGNRLPDSRMPVAAPTTPAPPVTTQLPIDTSSVPTPVPLDGFAALPDATTLPPTEGAGDPAAEVALPPAEPVVGEPVAPTPASEAPDGAAAPPAPIVGATATVNLGPVSATVQLNPSCSGVRVANTAVGCPPAPAESAPVRGVVIEANAPVVGERTVTVPLSSGSSGSLL